MDTIVFVCTGAVTPDQKTDITAQIKAMGANVIFMPTGVEVRTISTKEVPAK